MKLKERQSAREMRESGFSLNEIAKRLKVSKSSVSVWVSDIELNQQQMRDLKQRSHSDAAVEARRQSRLRNENARRKIIMDMAQAEIKMLSLSQIFFLGVALYWGEGTKKKRGVVEFTNSDPKMIYIMMQFLKKVCAVPDSKFRGHVFIHEHLPTNTSEKYWSEISGIPLKQFHKTSVQHNRNRIHKDTLPRGTFAIIVCDTELKLRIMGWIEGISTKV